MAFSGDVAREKLQVWKNKADGCIAESKDKLFILSNDIWSCPELAYKEKQSHNRLVRFFSEEKGWTVDSHYKLDTAFRATWGPVGGKDGDNVVNIGFLCEYDALPGIGHACGHNLIAEVGAAAALGLKGALESEPNSPIRVKVKYADKPVELKPDGTDWRVFSPWKTITIF